MNAPTYFIENQHGPNPHDELEPAESARILRAHVLDGVELVHRHRMGERIADFVREHHGSGEMRLLRTKAEALGQSFTEGAYRYPGPRPRSRETGILMIADQLEATARSKAPADDAECDAIVRTTSRTHRRRGTTRLVRTDESGSCARRAWFFARVAGNVPPSVVLPNVGRWIRGLATHFPITPAAPHCVMKAMVAILGLLLPLGLAGWHESEPGSACGERRAAVSRRTFSTWR